MEEKELHFAGASWFNGTTDEIFLGTWFIEQGWITEEEICTGVYGYEDPCPMKPGKICLTWFLTHDINLLYYEISMFVTEHRPCQFDFVKFMIFVGSNVQSC